MTLFNSKAEWVALSEAVKDVMFVIQLMASMKISFKLPVTTRDDYVGAIFMASNITNTSCTKHMDIRYKYKSSVLKMD